MATKKIDLPESESLTRTQLLEVESLLNKFAGGELLIPKDSNENEETIIKRNIQLLDWFKNHVFYLPTELNPEGFIWTKSDSPIKNTLIEESDVDNEKVDFKLKFRKLSMQLYPDTTDLTSSEIFTIQRLLLNGIPKEDPDLKNISISITSAFSQANK